MTNDGVCDFVYSRTSVVDTVWDRLREQLSISVVVLYTCLYSRDGAQCPDYVHLRKKC